MADHWRRLWPPLPRVVQRLDAAVDRSVEAVDSVVDLDERPAPVNRCPILDGLLEPARRPVSDEIRRSGEPRALQPRAVARLSLERRARASASTRMGPSLGPGEDTKSNAGRHRALVLSGPRAESHCTGRGGRRGAQARQVPSPGTRHAAAVVRVPWASVSNPQFSTTTTRLLPVGVSSIASTVSRENGTSGR
jgi:hypothetical protein